MTEEVRKDQKVKAQTLKAKYKSATLDEFIEQYAKDIGLGDLIEGIVLHAFDGRAPFSAETLAPAGFAVDPSYLTGSHVVVHDLGR